MGHCRTRRLSHVGALALLLGACGPQLAFTEQAGSAPEASTVTTGGTPPPAPPPQDANTVGTDPNVAKAPPTIAELLSSCQPTAGGNSFGVGAPCPKGSQQCGAKAPFCTGDYPALKGMGSPMCSAYCQSAAGCGNGDGKCVQDPNNSLVFVCVPSSCIPDGVTLVAPTPLSRCLPNNGAGNSLGIGKKCSGVTECNFAAGQGCTSAYAYAPVDFCSAACQTDRDCYRAGSVADAVCVLNPLSNDGARGCVPLACAP